MIYSLKSINPLSHFYFYVHIFISCYNIYSIMSVQVGGVFVPGT